MDLRVLLIYCSLEGLRKSETKPLNYAQLTTLSQKDRRLT